MNTLRLSLVVCALGVSLGATAVAQGTIASLRWSAGVMSIAEGGILRCEVGQEVQLSLDGEDAAMNDVPMQMYAPVVASSNTAVVRAANEPYAHIVNVRCVANGEAWLSAETRGLHATFPVLVGTARRQAGMTTPAPTPTGAVGASGGVAGAVQPAAAAPQVDRAVEAAKSLLGIFGRRP